MKFQRIIRKVCLEISNFSSAEIFNSCENGYQVLLAIPGRINVDPLFMVIFMEGAYSISHGLIHNQTSMELVKQFIAAVVAVKE